VAAKREDALAILQDAKAEDIPVHVVGLAGGTAVSVNGAHHLELDRLRQAWEGWLPSLMSQEAMAAE
jgi:phosphoribosylformylglycinamidine synthase